MTLTRLLQVREYPRPWIEQHLWIRDKERRLVPLRFNAAQEAYYAKRTNRDIILKPRQLGFTTLICGLFLADTLLCPNTVSAIVVHEQQAAERVFAIVRLFWEQMPETWQSRYPPRLASKHELYWPSPLNSHIYVITAGALGAGRGRTIDNLLCSELAYWPRPEETLAALTEAVPKGGRIIVESTPNGAGNHFHDLWLAAKRGESDFERFLFCWFEDPDYRLGGPALGELTREEEALRRTWGLDEDQLRWRRVKQKHLRERFAQEYAEDDTTCFLASGRCCFAVSALMRLQEQARQNTGRRVEVLPLRRRIQREVCDLGPVNVPPGRLTIWREPEEGKHYCIGADVAEGLEGGNHSAAVVLERTTGEQVAELHGQWPPHTFARLLAALGGYYHWAELAVERNNHGFTALHVLRRELRYSPLFWHSDPDTGSLRLGWHTSSKTKAKMVDDLAAAIAEGRIGIRSEALIQECTWFVSKDDGSQESQEGKSDDLVIAAAIAWQVKQKPLRRIIRQRPAGW